MIQLREYQKEASEKLTRLCNNYGHGYLSGECRTGKTLVALSVVKNIEADKVLIITKKKAISSIKKDIDLMDLTDKVVVTNFEQLKNFEGTSWNIVIVDEAHSVGAFPKPSQRQQNILKLRYGIIILMSGTPSPESWSQLYHQFALTNVWNEYSRYGRNGFYKWAGDYVEIKEKRVGTGIVVKDYSDAYVNVIKRDIEPFMVYMTQKEAGFSQEIEENVHLVKMSKRTYRLALRIIKTGVIGKSKGRSVLADTGVKVMSKLKQLFNGHVITEKHGTVIFDKSKVEYIKDTFKGKTAIMYCYKAEEKMLKKVFGDRVTEDPVDFNSNDDKVFIGQVRSSREGVNLSSADDVVFLGIDYSALSYLQGRERASYLGRDRNNKVHYIFAEKSIEPKVFEVVQSKENYTINHYRDHRAAISKEANRQIRKGGLDGDQTYYVQQSWTS